MSAREIDIEMDDAVRILANLQGGKDPLGMLRWYDDVVEILDEHVRQFAADLLAGFRSVPADTRRATLDDVSRALLEHRDADPDAVTALIASGGGLGITEDGVRFAVFGARPRPADERDTGIQIDVGDMRWDGQRLGPVALPETTLVAAVSRPLRDVITHPALDAFDLVVAGREADVLLVRPAGA